ncbi:MAG: copper chaperone PCu(A)C [Deltaproteobacteria bacterium]|jgi:copper(I)-binding protein|nr:copper chaperone PCu(A)C [Deltaproteobacteria bacterium]
MKVFFAMLVTFSTISAVAADMSSTEAKGLQAKIKIENVRVRLPAPGMKNTGMFMEISNTDAVEHTIVKATGTDSNIVELHDHIKTDGVMKMREIKEIRLKPGSKTVLKPGSLHVMLIDLKKELKEGEDIEVGLVFSNNETINVKGPVQKIQIPMKK